MPKPDPEQARRCALLYPDYWAMCHRWIDGAPWSFAGREYLKEVHRIVRPGMPGPVNVVGMKGAQTGWTEAAINIALFQLCHPEEASDVLYVLPTVADAAAFSQSRFMRAIDDSPTIAKLLGDVNNAHLKSLNRRSLYIRGSNSRSQLKSIPVTSVLLDEFDEMDAGLVALARKRSSGQDERRVRELNFSTPHIPGDGIHREYQLTDQREWHVPCPRCGELLPLTWPESIEWDGGDARRARWKCSACDHPMSDSAKRRAVAAGKWVATAPVESRPGYHLSQLYSPVMTARRAVEYHLKSLESEHERQEWFNSVLGLPYEHSAARLPLELVQQARTGPVMAATSEGTTAMGVDVGDPYCYWTIAVWTPDGHRRDVAMGKTDRFAHLSELMGQYRVAVAVIDANPERRKAREFVRQHAGRAYMCFYPEMEKFITWEHAEGVVKVNRTESLDRYLARFRRGTITLPADCPDRYLAHHVNLVRRFITGARGQQIARYVAVGADHWAHAANYAEVAGLLCTATADPLPQDSELLRERNEAQAFAYEPALVGDDEWGFDNGWQ